MGKKRDEFIPPPAHCIQCGSRIFIPFLAPLVRCSGCGMVNKITRIKGMYLIERVEKEVTFNPDVPQEDMNQRMEDEVKQEKERSERGEGKDDLLARFLSKFAFIDNGKKPPETDHKKLLN